MKYTWSFNKKAYKQFQKTIDRPVQVCIVKWLNTHIQDSPNHRIWGKALEGSMRTLWRYRVGDYRIIADIQDDVFVVVIIKVGKRNDIYKR